VDYAKAGREALEASAEAGAELVGSEFCNFAALRGSERYVDIVRAAAEGAAWSEIKRYLEIKHGVIHDPKFAGS